MKTLKATTLQGNEIELSFTDGGTGIEGAYDAVKEENFKVYNQGQGWTDFVVGDEVVRKTRPTFLVSGFVSRMFINATPFS